MENVLKDNAPVILALLVMIAAWKSAQMIVLVMVYRVGTE